MTVSQLIVELDARGVRLEVVADRLRYSPQAAVTPKLAEQLRAHKQAILAIFRAPDTDLALAWQAALDNLEASGELPAPLIAVCRNATVRWAVEMQENAGKRSK